MDYTGTSVRERHKVWGWGNLEMGPWTTDGDTDVPNLRASRFQRLPMAISWPSLEKTRWLMGVVNWSNMRVGFGCRGIPN